MTSFSFEVLHYLLHNFTEVKAFGSSAAVCAEWRRVLRDEAFWKIACTRRWPSIVAIPIQDFFKYYRSHVISQRDAPDADYDAAKFNEWLQDTYLMIEASVAGKLVSLALPFSDAVRDNEALGWQVSQFGCDESGDGGFQLGVLFFKTCHLWRASDGRLCLLRKNVVMMVSGLEHSTTFTLKPVRFFAEPDSFMSLQLRFCDSGVNAHESLMDLGLTIVVSYEEKSDNEHYTLRGASLRKPILTLHGWIDKRSFVHGRVAPQPGRVPAFWGPVGICDLFHMTSILNWR